MKYDMLAVQLLLAAEEFYDSDKSLTDLLDNAAKAIKDLQNTIVVVVEAKDD